MDDDFPKGLKISNEIKNKKIPNEKWNEELSKIKINREDMNKLVLNYLIIEGDFGAIWNANTLDRDLYPYEKLPFTVLFIDGNHENFDILNSYPVTKWNGGNVHIIRKNIIHLMRGQVFNIEGKTIFTFGGGTSIDKYRREEHISWWKEEIPSKEEINEGIILESQDKEVRFRMTLTEVVEELLNNNREQLAETLFTA